MNWIKFIKNSKFKIKKLICKKKIWLKKSINFNKT